MTLATKIDGQLVELEKAIHETPIHLLRRSDALLKITAQAEVARLQDTYPQNRLERYGFKVFSQNDEDGIIQKIFELVGTSSRIFFEFGVGDGLESNTAYLLRQGWKGVWGEPNPDYQTFIRRVFKAELESGQLALVTEPVTPGNVVSLAPGAGKGQIDLVSIDIDSNDYYVMEAAFPLKPRVIVCEYNAAYPPPAIIVQKYDPSSAWTGGNYYGASLQALVDLAKANGYVLGGTNLCGVNAFFVRDDLLPVNAPLRTASAADLYNPARYELGAHGFGGHPPAWGPLK